MFCALFWNLSQTTAVSDRILSHVLRILKMNKISLDTLKINLIEIKEKEELLLLGITIDG